jgi:diacylglycerol O-acyltransferase / wax synthase
MRQLSGHDASFLYADNPHANSNVSFVLIYDQSTAPGGTVRFKSILAHIESRLHRLPVFRQKLLRVPLELDYPYWIEDEHFDLEYHVRHIALPKPGDWRQFCIQASRIHARALDLNRPLWEIYVIEGLDSLLELPHGSFALLVKVHHAAVDVENRSEIVEVLHDIVPDPKPPAPPEPWFPEPAPGAFSLMCRGALGIATAPWRLAGPLWRAAPAAMAFAGDVFKPTAPTGTRFNSVVSSHRVFDTRRFLLDEFRDIRTLVPGATVNDAVLAVCGGALRAYLQANDELPANDLMAVAPIYIRGADGVEAGRPEVSFLEIALGTHLADPVERLRHIHAQTSSSTTVSRAVSARELTDVNEHAPAATLALTSKLFGRALAAQRGRTPLPACTITNVPGPSVPLYLNGARMTYFSAILPVSDGMGLAFAVTSYDGRIVISPTSCRELMPDPLEFTQCVRDSFQDLLALARKAPRPSNAVAKKAVAAKRRAARPAARRASSAGTPPPTPRVARKASTRPRAAKAGRPRSTTPSR